MDIFEDPDAEAAFWGLPTQSRPRMTSAALRRQPNVQSTSITSMTPPVSPRQQAMDTPTPQQPPQMGQPQPMGQPMPQPMGNPQDIRAQQSQRAMQGIQSAQSNLERLQGPQDYTQMQEYAKERSNSGRGQLLLALAAKQAGEEFGDVGGLHLKQAMAARDPIKTATGIIDDQGRHIEDPQAKAEQRIKVAQAQINKYEQIIQSNATAEEKAKAQQDMLEWRREMQKSQMEFRQMMAGFSAENRNAARERQTQDSNFRNANILRDDFTKATEKPRESLFQAKQVLSVIPNVANMTAAQQMATVYPFMRMLDPGSVVRESEYAMAERTRGLFDTIRNYEQQLINGKRLTPKQVLEMQAVAGDIVKAMETVVKQKEAEFADIATRNRLGVRDVIPGYAGSGQAAVVPQGAVRPRGAQPTAPVPQQAPQGGPPPGAVRPRGAQ